MISRMLMSAASGKPSLIGVATGSQSGFSLYVDLSGIQIQSGDLLVVFIGNNLSPLDQSQPSIISPPTSVVNTFSELYARLRVFARICDGSEDTIHTGAAYGDSYVVIASVWRNAQIGPFNSANSGNPPSVSTNQKSLVLVFGGVAASTIDVTIPSGYEEISKVQHSGCSIWCGYTKHPDVPSEDPPALGFSGLSGDGSMTLAVEAS